MSKFINSSKEKLTRDQLAGVIRANVEAFKDDPNFYDYLTELVIYLMEYEYDWPIELEQTAMPHATKNYGSNSNTSTHSGTRAKYRFEFIQPINLAMAAAEKRYCRVCGGDITGKLVCPNCLARNKAA